MSSVQKPRSLTALHLLLPTVAGEGGQKGRMRGETGWFRGRNSRPGAARSLTHRLIVRAGVAVLTACVAGAAFAHHSFAMFDREKQVKLVGKVHEFQWTNPHAWIEVDVPNDKGGTDRWGVELNSPNNLTRQGWRSSSLKAGDAVTVTINPLRSGEKGGLFVSVVLPSGKVLGSPSGPPAGGAAAEKPGDAAP